MSEMNALGLAIRRTVLEQSRRANVGHIGSCLSVADLLAALYGDVLTGEGGERDRMILSKGHAALALYAALLHTGRMAPEALDDFCGDGSLLGTHPEYIDFSTGSLGHPSTGSSTTHPRRATAPESVEV